MSRGNKLKVKSEKLKVYEFKGKKVLIMGLGLHGGGVSVANYFIKQGAHMRITDLKSREELLASIKKIKVMDSRWSLPRTLIRGGNDKIQYTLGKHLEKDFRWADIVVQNPGVPKESKFLRIARKHGAEIENEATLFFKIVGRERIIGVTGTRGKSTTTAIIYNIVKEKYPHALFGGNIATSPMFSIIQEAKKTHSPVVLELSSWHLENLGEKKLSPRIAVFTNLYPDHLNRYKNIDEYGEAKRNIFKNQTVNDFAVLNWDNFFTLSYSKFAPSQVYWFGKRDDIDLPGACIKDGWIIFATKEKEEKIFHSKEINILGEHNLENILAAVLVAKILNIDNETIFRAIKDFKGLEHRLEFVKTIHGVQYINDTAATTPDGTIAALKTLSTINNPRSRTSSLRGRQPLTINNIILVAGGGDKGIPQEKFNELGELIGKHCKAVILFSGKGSEKIYKSLIISNFQPASPAGRFPISNKIDKMSNVKCQMSSGIKTMADALGIAKSFAKRGDIILLSPACASFGLFKHEFDRGDQFKKIVSEV